MPNKKSAIKRVKTSEKSRIYNRFWKTRCKTEAKKVLAAVTAGDYEGALKCLDDAQSVLDKAQVKGVIPRNTVARRKAGLTARVKALAPAAE